MSTRDDDIEFELFRDRDPEEPPGRPARGGRGGGPRRPISPSTGAVALARLVGLVALAIAVVVALVFWVGACQGKSRHDEYRSYMESVSTVAQSSAKTGRQLAAKVGSQGLKLADLETSLAQWSQQQQQLYDQAQVLRPPGPLRSTHQQLLDTLQLRAIGLAGLANDLAQPGTSDPSKVAAKLANEAQLLTASDIVWTQLYKLPATETLKALGITGVVVPASQFVQNPDLVSVRSFTVLYQRLRPGSAVGTPGGVHGDSLAATRAVGGGRTTALSTSKLTTIYVSADLQFQVTVEDSGNFQEVNVPVTMTVAVGGKKLFSRRQQINGIQPGEQQTVVFGNLQLTPEAFGHNATVKVVVGGVPGETKLDNNKATYPVLFSLSPP